jgi:NAD(P)-dependent dehydrogenase (short-subunit alcohol dehydrogenase family)
MGKLKDKVALVTGAAGGIGAAIASAFAAEGARVVVADIDRDGAHRQAEQLTAAGLHAIGVAADIGDPISIEKLFQHAISTYGGIDVLCNNAAATRIAAERDGAIADMDIAVWDDTMRINLRGTMLMCKAAIAAMRQRGGGAIINVSSGSSRAGSLSNSAYAISKAGVVCLSKYVATQCGHEGIRCNTISPGYIVTPAKAPRLSDGTRNLMLKHNLCNRLGQVEDIAAAAVYLASDDSGYVTGHELCVDGGLLAHQPYCGDLRGGSGSVSS